MYPTKAVLLFALLTLLCTSGRAQNELLASQPYSITGTLAFPDGYRPGGNVMVLHPSDSSLLTGDFFLEGEFTVGNIAAPEVLLRFTSLEFADVYQGVINDGQTTINLGQITVQPAGLNLDAVVVRGRKPVYTQRPDGTVEVLVANTVLAASSSATEILARTPDVRIDEDGNLSVLGKGQAIIYLDGQPITPEQLVLVAPANVQKIAVIRNPSARYHASGGAVIEITTLRGRDDGYRISLQQNTGNSAFGGWQSYSGANLIGNRGRLAAQANYALQQGNDRHVKFTTRDRTDPTVFLSSAVNIDWQQKLEAYHYYGLGLQYDAPGGGAISLGYTGFTEKLGGNTFNTNRLMDAEGTLDYATTISRNERDQNNSFSLNYRNEFDSLGSNLFIGGQYVRFDNSANNPILEIGVTPAGPTERRLLNLLDLNIDVTSVQMDYTKVFPAGHRMEAGLRYGRVVNDADLNFFIAEAGEDFVSSDVLSSIYLYNESVSAGYLSMSGQLSDRLRYKVGLRTENTDYTLSLTENAAAPLSDNYLNLFPNAALTLSLPQNRSLHLSYTSRIRRPPYQSLNPNLIYQDPYTSIQGNPGLIPEKIRAVELVGKSGATTMKLGYSFTQDPLSGGAIRGADPRSYVLKRLNFSKDVAWYASATHTIQTDWWTSNNTASVSYSKASAFGLDYAFVEPEPQPYFFTDNRFRVGQFLHFEVLFWYVGTLYEGTFNRYDSANLTLAADKIFFNDALKVRLIANDVFNTVRASGEYAIGETDIYFDNKWRSSYFRLALTANFGQLKKARYNNRATGSSEESRIR